MKNYDQYTLEDFVQDFYFRRWVLGKLDPKDTFWETWCKENPEKELLIQEASSMVIGLSYEPDVVKSEEIFAAISRVQKRIHKRALFSRKWFYYAAAAIVPTASLLVLWLVGNSQTEELTVAEISSDVRWEVNEGREVVPLTLSDGSTVQLGPGSRLGYTNGFGITDRFVWLEGEAYFEVIKNTESPFIVNSHNVLTKVLGTTFHVRAYSQDENVSISVTSGKVTVQKKTFKDAEEMDPGPELILTPNQQAVVSRKNDKIIKTLIETPAIIKVPEQHRHFIFNDTPISEVFQTLEEAYGIPIAFDNEKLAKCNLTAQLSNEDLFDKLDLICETIQASYQVTDGQIVIRGAGCE